MKIVERKNNEIIELEKIESIDGLENSALVLLERGDKIKKAVKGGRSMFGNKNLMSVKSMKEAIAENAEKQNKKAGKFKSGNFCCVCTDWFHDSELDSLGVCPHCQLM